MSEDSQQTGGKVAPRPEGKNALTREPSVTEIRDALDQVIEKIGHSRLIMASGENSGWWECFSHGLAMPIRDGEMYRITDSAGYIQTETDYLNLDEEGLKRKYGEGGLSDQKEPIRPVQLKSLALRVAAFIQVRKELLALGFSLPENPNLESAEILVKSELAKDVRARSSWEQLSGGKKLPKQLPETTKQM